MTECRPPRCTLTLTHNEQHVTIDVPHTDDAVELLRLATYAMKAVGFHENTVQSAVAALAEEYEPVGELEL